MIYWERFDDGSMKLNTKESLKYGEESGFGVVEQGLKCFVCLL